LVLSFCRYRMKFPCPHTRELTDAELEAIAADGLRQVERIEQQKKQSESQPLEGDEWKDGQ
jgi:hypothetical protein